MRFLADENFHNDILRGLLRHYPALDIVRVQDTAFAGVDDPTLLAEAANLGAILLTHDVRTMPKYAYERVQAGLAMPGVIEISNRISIGEAIQELQLVIEAGVPSDFANQVRYIPIR